MHRYFLNKLSMYHVNGSFIIQLYSQLHKGGLNIGRSKSHWATNKKRENACHYSL